MLFPCSGAEVAGALLFPCGSAVSMQRCRSSRGTIVRAESSQWPAAVWPAAVYTHNSVVITTTTSTLVVWSCSSYSFVSLPEGSALTAWWRYSERMGKTRDDHCRFSTHYDLRKHVRTCCQTCRIFMPTSQGGPACAMTALAARPEDRKERYFLSHEGSGNARQRQCLSHARRQWKREAKP